MPALRALGALVLVVSLTAGCARRPADPRGFAVTQTIADLSAFSDRPSEQTWVPLRAALFDSPADPALESSVIDALARQPVPVRVLDAAAVDLATSDWAGTMKWVRAYNVMAQTNPAPAGRTTVAATAHLAWLLLALRAAYAKDAVDLTRTDLRDADAYIGQAMNFANVDFSESRLSGGQWHGSNVGGASFSNVLLNAPLQCSGCTFGSVKYPGTVALRNGQWVPAH